MRLHLSRLICFGSPLHALGTDTKFGQQHQQGHEHSVNEWIGFSIFQSKCSSCNAVLAKGSSSLGTYSVERIIARSSHFHAQPQSNLANFMPTQRLAKDALHGRHQMIVGQTSSQPSKRKRQEVQSIRIQRHHADALKLYKPSQPITTPHHFLERPPIRSTAAAAASSGDRLVLYLLQSLLGCLRRNPEMQTLPFGRALHCANQC